MISSPYVTPRQKPLFHEAFHVPGFLQVPVKKVGVVFMLVSCFYRERFTAKIYLSPIYLSQATQWRSG